MDAVLQWLFATPGLSSIGECLKDSAGLLRLQSWCGIVIAGAYLAIPLSILWVLRSRTDLFRQYRVPLWLGVTFLLAAAAVQVVSVLTLWYPAHGGAGVVKAGAALVSTAALAYIWPLLPQLARLPSPAQLADANDRLRREVAGHEATLRELETARRELESRVEERTRELALTKARFETALRGAKVYVFSQDLDLRYTWVYSPRGPEAAAEMLGRTDDEIAASSPEHDAIAALKRRVIETGQPGVAEAFFATPEGRTLMALHVDPTFDERGALNGIMCAAIDVSRIRSLEGEQRRLTEELGTALQRYETALRGSNVTVYTQDRDLRYTSVSSPLFGMEVAEIVGRTDEDVLPAESRDGVVAIKREVLDSGQPKDSEARVDHQKVTHWYDFHIEPLRDVTGAIVGLTCAAVDISERKEGEAHLRLLMRELTHRSKNLLAVIHAMARQTARNATTTEAFLEQFTARLQALATSHDLLIQESWHGASLYELVRSQLGHYVDRGGSQIAMHGTSVLLKPEAAQSLGLALHELATNAVKYGALSAQNGKVAITWGRQPDSGAIEILWSESGGPPVTKPTRRGFGSLVIERNLAQSLDATVELTFPPEGVQCRIVIPAGQLSEGR